MASPGQSGSQQGPQVTLGVEQWRPAATWQQVAQTIGGGSSSQASAAPSAAPPPVHEYAGAMSAQRRGAWYFTPASA